jgi:hypothetical protein
MPLSTIFHLYRGDPRRYFVYDCDFFTGVVWSYFDCDFRGCRGRDRMVV